MFDGTPPVEPDWKVVAQLAMQQRDRTEARAANLEIDLALSQRREAQLQARVVELEAEKAPELVEPR